MPSNDRKKFIRVSADHPLDLFIDPSRMPKYLMLISNMKPRQVDPTGAISIRSDPREDGSWSLLFELETSHFEQIFRRFCEDAIASSNEIIDPAIGPDFLINRFNEWKKMFERPSGVLGENQIQGLIGEMVFLKDVLIPRYGEENALLSWMNAKRGKQDFICTDRWYEVKSIKTGRHTVTITSLDQLDRDTEGGLGIITLRDTSPESPEGITINSLNNIILTSLSQDFLKKMFSEIMASAGYETDPRYDRYIFELVKIDEFKVKDDFPRLRRSRMIYPAITDANYEILIEKLELFRA